MNHDRDYRMSGKLPPVPTRFNLTVELFNAAFENPGELARILKELSSKMDGHHDGHGVVKDINGNTVGSWKIV